MSLFAELKRRNVVKVGAAYLLVAWLVVQAASIGFPAFDAPAWALRVFIFVLLLGFPIALAMAWMFEVTPEGLKRDSTLTGNKRMMAIAGVLVALAVGWYFQGQPALRKSAIPAGEVGAVNAPAALNSEAGQPAAAQQKSIAVLPFVNMSADTGNQFFADGISEELLNVLVRVDGLGVASRTSSFAYKGSGLGALAIARELKVNYILEGSVRKAGNRVRITAQLIDALHDRHLWSETYDRELTDIFAIQDEIANAIVTALRGSLSAEKSKPAVTVRADTENMQAYELYLKARENFIARRELPETVRLFEKVVELDPKFARGWEGLAAVCSVMRSWGFDDREYTSMAKRAAERALQLDTSLSMPWAVLSQVESEHWPVDWPRKLNLLDKAIAADPRNATAFLWRGIAWTELGFFDRAIADQERCLALEPGYHNCLRHKALALLFASRTDEAIALFDRGLANGYVRARATSFVAPLLQRGDRTAALLLLDQWQVKPEVRVIVMTALSKPDGPRPNAKAIVDRYLADKNDPTVKNLRLTRVYLWLGDYDRVGSSDDSATGEIVAWDRYPATFRNSPGMKLKLVNMGALTYWRKKGFPPQCRPVGDKDFTCD